MSDIFSSEEDNSVEVSNVSWDGTDEASPDSEDEFKPRRTKKRIAIVDSDSESDDEVVASGKSEIAASDSEDDEAERRALSPRTRKKNAESEIDYSSEEDSPKQNAEKDENESANIESLNVSADKSLHTSNDVSPTKNGNRSSDRSSPQHSSYNLISPSPATPTVRLKYPLDETPPHPLKSPLDATPPPYYRRPHRTPLTPVNKQKSLRHKSLSQVKMLNISERQPSTDMESPGNNERAPRYTMQFDANIKNILSSTICGDAADIEQKTDSQNGNKSDSSHSSGDVQFVSINNAPIELSSSDEVVVSPVKTEMVRPKIHKAFAEMPPPLKPPRSAKKAVKGATKIVSQDFYDKECKKLMDLKQELQQAENLIEKIGGNLRDGGRNLTLRCERLKLDIDVKTKFIETLSCESSVKAAQKNDGAAQIPSWEALSQGVNEVQPTHTGAKGMKTFNTQKALTAERLKEFHGSLENRPKETELADTPRGLKVELMPHQRHALKWMAWREKQNPRGGILADDMGLGKTLSMIALVLAAKNRRENDGSSDDDDESEDENDGAWYSKGRRTKYNGGTLVVCPASLASQWEGEVQRRVASRHLSVIVHHGPNRDTKPKHLRTYDIVITTYAIVSREHKTEGPIFGLKWRRIILDEGHVIRNHKAQMSVAACELRGTYRWIVTGTPVQNKVQDLFALLKFLRCSPFDDLGYWQRWIARSNSGQDRMQAVMQTLLLRRTKENLQARGDLGSLPDKQLQLIEVKLDKDEMNVYQKVMVYSRTLFAQFLFQRAERDSDLNFIRDAAKPTYMQKQDPNGAYYKLHEKFTRMHTGSKEVKSHEILTLLLRLRQICCHAGLIDAMLEGECDVSLDSDQNSTQPEIDLLAQLNKLATEDNTNDSHNDTPNDQAMAKASAKVMQRSNPVFDFGRCSSKIGKVLETLQHILSTTTDKAIIVSQWSNVLRVIRDHLSRRNIATVVMDGSVPVKNRQGIVDDFNRATSSNRILLLSLTAGGVGLNLVGANHILLVDLHWNPQLEAQAQDRIYRVGQKKNVFIHKFMCVDTIEARIKALQDKKLELANGVLDGTRVSKGSQLSLQDLRGLFEM